MFAPVSLNISVHVEPSFEPIGVVDVVVGVLPEILVRRRESGELVTY